MRKDFSISLICHESWGHTSGCNGNGNLLKNGLANLASCVFREVLRRRRGTKKLGQWVNSKHEKSEI
jgi:hypothetical protein